MAVYAAHLTRTLQGRPSVFQVTAQEALGDTVKPALRKLIQYLAAVYPDKFGWCERWYDEVYLVLDCCLQYHYLKYYAASFSESFYGLLRVPASVSNEFSLGERLPERLERASLALLVLMPYITDKLQNTVDKWKEELEDGRFHKGGGRSWCVRAYSVVHAAACGARLYQLARYLQGATRAHSPALAALGLALHDAPAHQAHHAHIGDALSFPVVGGALLRLCEYGAFCVQFLRWWESSEQRQAPTRGLPTPPPPERDSRSERWRNKCPLCAQPWRTPTVLPVSGYVFCYVCISRHVRAAGACPVSRLPADERAIIRLYAHQ